MSATYSFTFSSPPKSRTNRSTPRQAASIDWNAGSCRTARKPVVSSSSASESTAFCCEVAVGTVLEETSCLMKPSNPCGLAAPVEAGRGVPPSNRARGSSVDSGFDAGVGAASEGAGGASVATAPLRSRRCTEIHLELELWVGRVAWHGLLLQISDCQHFPCGCAISGATDPSRRLQKSQLESELLVQRNNPFRRLIRQSHWS